MRQKIQKYREQIRHNAIHKYFHVQREQLLSNSSKGREVTLIINEEDRVKRGTRRQDEEDMEAERRGMEIEEEGKLELRIVSAENELNSLRENSQWQ